MKKESCHLFNKSQRNGVFVLLLIIVILQSVWFYLKNQPTEMYILTETQIAFQKQVDSLRKVSFQKKKDTIYPFNPNFITDYRGYILGMNTEEIDRLLAFRKTGKFINSVKEFQQVTQISDSLLNHLQVYFKFPEWVKNKKNFIPKYEEKSSKITKPIIKKDLNTATADDFREVRGIGEVLSKRIIKYRKQLHGFSDKNQLYEIYGIEDEVADRLLERFEIQTQPNIQKININLATMSELAKTPYLNYQEAKAVVALRSELGNITDKEQLLKIDGFSQKKIDRILLYLSLD